MVSAVRDSPRVMGDGEGAYSEFRLWLYFILQRVDNRMVKLQPKGFSCSNAIATEPRRDTPGP
jgi:hypothetical protein